MEVIVWSTSYPGSFFGERSFLFLEKISFSKKDPGYEVDSLV